MMEQPKEYQICAQQCLKSDSYLYDFIELLLLFLMLRKVWDMNERYKNFTKNSAKKSSLKLSR